MSTSTPSGPLWAHRRRLWPWMDTELCFNCFRPKIFCARFGCDPR